MLLSLAIIMLFGLLANALFEKIKLPGLLGMLLVGVALAQLGWIDQTMLALSGDLRKIALVIILLRSGLSIKRQSLAQVGSTALKMSLLPSLAEAVVISLCAWQVLGFSWVQAGLLGFVITAVSPAVVVPAMIDLQQRGLGLARNIPTIMLASASADNILAVTLFSALMGLAAGGQAQLTQKMWSTPLSIVLGVLVGLVLGGCIIWLFQKTHMRDTRKVLLILATAIFITALEARVKPIVDITGLLSIMTIGFLLMERLPKASERLALKLQKVWLFAEIMLFVLVGVEVKMQALWQAGWVAVVILLLGLLARSIGVWISLHGSVLLQGEKIFCIIAFIPKATVQAAFGAVPLAMGLAGGETILVYSVLSILLTAPLGAIGIRLARDRYLK